MDGVVEKIEPHADGSRTIYLNVGAKKASTSDKNYVAAPGRFIEVKVGDEVKKGQFLTDGAANLEEMLSATSKENTQEYIFGEVSVVYDLAGYKYCTCSF